MIQQWRLLGICVLVLNRAVGQSGDPSPRFEAASVKVADAKPNFAGAGASPGRLNFPNATMQTLLELAYRVEDYQIFGPGWFDGPGAPQYAVTATWNGASSPERIQMMLRALLSERFKLSLHHEERELPVYILTVGKAGPKLQKSTKETPGRSSFGRGGPGRIVGVYSMDVLSTNLVRFVQRPVLDRTQLEGLFDVDLRWTPEAGQGRLELQVNGQSDAPPGETREGSIFTAVQEQLGLKLTAQKGPVEVLVVDHVEKTPTEN